MTDPYYIDDWPPPPVPVLPFWSGAGAPPALDPAQITPTVDDVAQLERTRTVNDGGSDAGTFTNTTRPTAQEVNELIGDALAEVVAVLPTNVDPIWYPAIKRLVALRTAATVEASYFREQSDNANAPSAQYTAELTAIQRLIPVATYVG